MSTWARIAAALLILLTGLSGLCQAQRHLLMVHWSDLFKEMSPSVRAELEARAGRPVKGTELQNAHLQYDFHNPLSARIGVILRTPKGLLPFTLYVPFGRFDRATVDWSPESVRAVPLAEFRQMARAYLGERISVAGEVVFFTFSQNADNEIELVGVSKTPKPVQFLVRFGREKFAWRIAYFAFLPAEIPIQWDQT